LTLRRVKAARREVTFMKGLEGLGDLATRGEPDPRFAPLGISVCFCFLLGLLPQRHSHRRGARRREPDTITVGDVEANTSKRRD
jgi:hypothetical protein